MPTSMGLCSSSIFIHVENNPIHLAAFITVKGLPMIDARGNRQVGLFYVDRFKP
jgi:hypothetical protein